MITNFEIGQDLEQTYQSLENLNHSHCKVY